MTDPTAVFHRVRQLVPNDQELVYIAEDTLVAEALRLMHTGGYDQLPVVAGDEILGVFSFREFALRLNLQPGLLKRGYDALVVEDFVEEVPLMRETDNLDLAVRQLRINGIILVGDPNSLLAIITSDDLVAYLHRLSEPYFLVQEIELGVRALIESCADEVAIRDAIQNALTSKYSADLSQMPDRVDDLTYDEQVSVVINGRNYPMFQPAFGRHADAVRLQLRPVGDLRNAVFHFRRPLSMTEVGLLMETRNWVLRRCRRFNARPKGGQGVA